MTINHVFLHISYTRFATARAFYIKALKPLGYTEMMYPRDDLIAFGSDFPYLWLKRLPEGEEVRSTHIAIDASNNKAVDDFWRAAQYASPVFLVELGRS